MKVPPLEDRVDDLLTYLELATPLRAEDEGRGPEFFGEPIVVMGPDDILTSSEFLFHSNPRPSLLKGETIDVSNIVPVIRSGDGARSADSAERMRFVLMRARQINPELKQYRKYLTHARHYMLEVSMAPVFDNGTYARAHSSLWGWNGSGWESCWQLTSADDRASLLDMSKQCGLMLAAQVAKRELWSVTLSVHQRAVSFLTDPAGARAAFKFRDVPAGHSRRAALRHWVSEHKRRKESGDGVSLVREHLRGATTFDWHGMRCKLTPSAVDLERLALKESE